MQVQHFNSGIFAIHDFLSLQECSDRIGESERIGYSEALIKSGRGEERREDVRNNARILLDNPGWSDDLFGRALDLLPIELYGAFIDGFNERWRYYRYTKHQKFDWHWDGTVSLPPDRESMLTFMIYLNDDFEGGDTEFEAGDIVRPARGMALVFPHKVRHRGAIVSTGTKYVLRTDVLYRVPRGA
jgi:hypothetical protein